MSKRKNKKSKIKFFSIFSFLILAILSISLFIILISMNVLPLKYLIPLIIIYGLILFGIGKVSIRKKFKSWFKVLISIVSIIFIILIVFILYYLNSTLNFMDKIKADDYQIEEFYIIANKKSNYKDLEELNNKKIGIYELTTSTYKAALKQLKEKIKINKTEYKDYIEASEAILNSEVDAILLSSAHKAIVEDIYESFKEDVEMIYTIEVKTEKNVKASNKDITNQPFNVYISGIDIYGDISSVSRSDVNMIVTVNPKTHKVLLTSIPRDYYVQLHGTTGLRDKLTHAGMYGIDMSIQTLQDLLDEKIDYYVRVNFSTVVSLVDAIGGIDIYSDASFKAWTDWNCYYRVGDMHLDGKCALAFARERHAYFEGDRHRVQNQQDVITAILNKALSSRTLVTKYSKILDSMGNSFETNIPSKSIYSLVNKQLDTMPEWDIERYSLNGTDKTTQTYSTGSEMLYVMEPDMSTVEEAKQKIDSIMNPVTKKKQKNSK